MWCFERLHGLEIARLIANAATGMMHSRMARDNCLQTCIQGGKSHLRQDDLSGTQLANNSLQHAEMLIICKLAGPQAAAGGVTKRNAQGSNSVRQHCCDRHDNGHLGHFPAAEQLVLEGSQLPWTCLPAQRLLS